MTRTLSLFLMLFVFGPTLLWAIPGGGGGEDEEETFKIIYGQEPYMITFNPVLYNGHTPWPDDKSQANGAMYYRLDYDHLEDGLWMVYYDEAKTKLFCEAHVLEGEPTGIWLYYYSNGQRMKEFSFEDGVWKGNVRRWYPSGRLHYEQVMDRTQDVCGHKQEFDSVGTLISESYFMRDVLLQTLYYDGGQVYGSETFNQGYHVWRKKNQQLSEGQPIDNLKFRIYAGHYKDGVDKKHTRLLKKYPELKDFDTGMFTRQRSDGTTDYFVGDFENFERAEEIVADLKAHLYDGLQVVGFVDGKPIGEDCRGKF